MDRTVGFDQSYSRGNVGWRNAITTDSLSILGLLVLATLVYGSLKKGQGQTARIFGASWFLAAYLPISNIVQLNASVAEHWLYLPSTFLFLAAIVALSRLRISVSIAASVAGLVVVCLGARTFVYTFDWKNQRTFLERTIAAGGDSPRMLINLASQDLHEDRLDAAQEHLEAALQKEQNQPLAVINTAVVAIRRKEYDKARSILNRAKDLPLVDAQAHELFAILEVIEHERVELLRFRLASRTGPPNWRLERRYIEALDQTGNTAAAVNELTACLKMQWYRAESWQLLSHLFSKSGPTREAMEALEQAKDYDVHLMEHPEVVQP